MTQFRQMTDEELKAKASSWLPRKFQSRMDELLALNGEGRLSAQQRVELEGLLDEVERLAIESAAAKIVQKLPEKINKPMEPRR